MKTPLSIILLIVSSNSFSANLLDTSLSASLTHVDAQLNGSWAGTQLTDNNNSTRWLSDHAENDLIYQFSPTEEQYCFNQFDLTNYGNNNRSIEKFMLLATNDTSLITDTGISGWTRVANPDASITEVNHTLWAQGGTLDSYSKQLNSSWAANHLNDGDVNTRWLSDQSNNTFEYSFDTDWDGSSGNTVDVTGINLLNYGNHNRAIKFFQVEVTTDDVNWQKLEVPGTSSGETDFNFALDYEGGNIDYFSSQLNASWKAAHIQDGDINTRWLSNHSNNSFEFSFDPNDDGINNASDYFQLKKIFLKNYGDHNRAIQDFQVEVKTASDTNWTKIPYPGSLTGEADFDFAAQQNDGDLYYYSFQLNSSWAANHLNDGDSNTRWLSNKSSNTIEFKFDPNEDGANDSDDYFTLDKIYLQNYGDHNRAINTFQVEVKTASNSNWSKIPAPGTAIGDTDFDFTSEHNGGDLYAYSSQLNSFWAADHLIDGDMNSRWLANRSNNTFEFQFDPNGDSLNNSDDYFTIDKIYLQNYGDHNRAIKDFQVEVKTASDTSWHKIPNTTNPSVTDFDYALSHNGGSLDNSPNQVNSSWAADHLNDGDTNTRWLTTQSSVTFEYSFDPDEDGINDKFNLNEIQLLNYGNHNRSIATFKVEYLNNGGIWKEIKDPIDGGSDTTFEAAKSSSLLTWSVDVNNVNGIRFTTLSNYGDTYTGAREIRFLGNSITTNTIFTANKNSSGQTWDIDPGSEPVDVTHVRLVTISNNGNTYTGAREFKVLGNSVTRSAIFTANKNSTGQTWDIDPSDEPVDLTHARLVTISNHGGTYTGAREFKLLGDSVTRSTIFTAAKNSNDQFWEIDDLDEPIDVTNARFVVISNYGNTFTGAREIGFLGDSVTANHTFTALKQSAMQTWTLDVDDQVSNIKKARLLTVQNYGDTYTGAREFELTGPIATANYVFTPDKNSTEQNFNISAASGKLFRFHTINNYGDTYTGAREIALQSTDINQCIPDPLAYYAMDENNWTSVLNGVIDSSTNGYHAQAINDASTNNASPAIPGASGTCNYGEFDGSGDYLNISNTPDLASDFTITTWVYAQDIVSNQILYSDDVNNLGFKILLGNAGSGKISIVSNATTPASFDTTAAVIAANQWYHLAVVHNNNTSSLKVYIDGISIALDNNSYTSSWSADSGGESLAGQSSGNFFKGWLDEFRIYNEVFTTAQIGLVKDLTHLCESTVDHYAISHSENGVTCEAEAITVTAHDSSHLPVAPSSSTTLQLSSTVVIDSWALKTGDGSFDGTDQYTFDGSETAIEFWLTHTSITLAPHIDINLTDGSATDPNDGGSEDPTLAFDTSAYRIYADGVNNDINTQIAFKSSSGDQVLTIKSVETNSETGACESRLEGTQTIQWAYECITPNTCANNSAVSITDNTLAAETAISGNDFSDITDYSDVDIEFLSGTATFTTQYDDVGKITLHLKQTIAAAGDDPEVQHSASSNQYVVKPAGLCVFSNDANSSCATSDESCSKFKVVDEAFNLKVKAVGWDSINGAESNSDLCDNPTADNFNLTAIALTHNLIAPSTAVKGSTNNTTFDITSGETTLSDQFISEVGIFTITVTPPNYQSEPISASTSSDIGRFYPDHFNLSDPFLNNRTDINPAGVGSFTYMNESFEIELTLKAVNSSNLTLNNYTGSFALLSSDADLNVEGENDHTTVLNRLGSSSNPISWLNGEASISKTLVFSRQSSPDGPYDNFYIGVAPTDSDGVILGSYNLDTDLDATNDHYEIDFTKIRFGRMNIGSAHGSELNDLSVPLVVEYFSAGSFITNVDDSDTTFNLTNLSLSNTHEAAQTDSDILITATHSTTATADTTFTFGSQNLELSNPCTDYPTCTESVGEQGYTNLDLTVDYSYLLFDWDNDTVHDNNPPTAKATFGIFKGNDKLIFIREVY